MRPELREKKLLYHHCAFAPGVIITVTFEEVYDTPKRNTAADKADDAFEYGAGSSDKGRGIDLAGACCECLSSTGHMP